MVILQAANPIEALRLKPNRLFVIRRGKIIARSQPLQSELDLPGRPKLENFQKYQKNIDKF
jgi:cytosine deaminase